MEVFEWRGVEGVVVAELLKDTEDELTYSPPFKVAGVAELGRTTENNSETHYYDNQPAITINSVGVDTVTLTMSGLSLDVLAKITGRQYDEALGLFIEGDRETKYFALGYKTEKTNGDEVYVWRYKGTFSIPESKHVTKKNDTSANGTSLVYTGISTIRRILWKDKKIALQAISVDAGLNLAKVDDFFTSVKIPTDIQAVSP